MRNHPRKQVESGRERKGHYATEPGDRKGLFRVQLNGTALRIIVSDGRDWKKGRLPGGPWEHVSVSTQTRTPTWEEMAWVKRQFWRDDEQVIQFHPPKHRHINVMEHCLHLWKPPLEVPLPPAQCV